MTKSLATRYFGALAVLIAIIAVGAFLNQKETVYNPGTPVSLSLSKQQTPPYSEGFVDGAYHILTVEAKEQRKFFAEDSGESGSQPYGVTSLISASKQAGFKVASPEDHPTTVLLYPEVGPITQVWAFTTDGALGAVTSDDSVRNLPEVDPRHMFSASPFSYSEEFSGESAGLTVGLAWLDILTPGDQSRGLKIYATGALSTNGQVISVENTQLKIQSALSKNADVVLVPRGSGITPEQKKTGKVVEVESLTEASEVIATWQKR